MLKLLHAGFARLFKSKIFWIGVAALGGLALWAVLARYYDAFVLSEMGYDNLDGLLFIGATYAPIWVPVFISLFVGTEYSDGTMRNKVVVGHSKIAIYLSNLIVCVAAVLMMHLAYIGVVLGLGLPLLGGFETISAKALVVFFFCSLATMVSLTALMLMVCMLIHNKAIGAIVAMLLGLVLIMGGMTIDQMLNAPEMITEGFIMNEVGDFVPVEPFPNPKYLTGFKRNFFQLLQDILPGNQLIVIGMSDTLPTEVWRLPVYAALLLLVCTVGGILAFRRKDLK